MKRKSAPNISFKPSLRKARAIIRRSAHSALTLLGRLNSVVMRAWRRYKVCFTIRTNGIKMKRRKIILITIACWLIICGLYTLLYVQSVLSLPTLVNGYEKDWTFQLTMFIIFRFPLLLIALVIIVAIENHFIKGDIEPNQKEDTLF